MATIATQMMSSTRVRPDSERNSALDCRGPLFPMRPERMGHPDWYKCSLHMYHGLGTDGRKIGLRAVVSADFDEGEVGVTGGDGLEGERADASLPVDSGRVGGTFGGDGDETGAVVAVGDGGDLAVAAKEVAGVDVDELEDGGIELHLEGHGEDVVRRCRP